MITVDWDFVGCGSSWVRIGRESYPVLCCFRGVQKVIVYGRK